MVLKKITEEERMTERARPLSLCVGGEGGSWREENQNPPEALHTSLFASQMFPQTLSVGCGPRRVESQYGFNWLVFLDCAL